MNGLDLQAALAQSAQSAADPLPHRPRRHPLDRARDARWRGGFPGKARAERTAARGGDSARWPAMRGNARRAPGSGSCARASTRSRRRELEVLGHVVQGRLNKQIAGDLGIHERTVKLHRTAITTKLARAIGRRTHAADRGGGPLHGVSADLPQRAVVGAGAGTYSPLKLLIRSTDSCRRRYRRLNARCAASVPRACSRRGPGG